MERIKLSKSDISKLKYEKRMGYVFSALILFTTILLNFSFFLTNREINQILKALLIDLVLITLSYLTSFLFNKKYNKDLSEGYKKIEYETIQDKFEKIDYEPGSGSLYIPILGDISPKIWGQKMKGIKLNILIIKNTTHIVESDIFENVKINDTVEMHYSIHSEILLDIKLKNERT